MKKQIVINQNIDVETYMLDDDMVLIIPNGLEVKAKRLICGTSSEIYLDKSVLTVESLLANDGFSMSGRGDVTVLNDFSCGKKSVLNLDDISLVLDGARLNLGEENVLSLGNYPIKGGEICGDIKLTSRIVASRKRIFKGVKVSGAWKIEKAYPEWFAELDSDNWASAINQAFGLSGVVSLDSRTYRITETIWVPANGQLIGTFSGEHDGDFGTILLTSEIDTGSNGTPRFNFSENYVIMANLKKDVFENSGAIEAIDQYSPIGVRIANILLDNRLKNYPQELSTYPKAPLYGILVAFKAEFEKIRAKSFVTVIRWDKDYYTDMKKITRCNFDDMRISDKERDYIVDFGGLGDALIFEGNAMHGGGSNKGILLESCYSGFVNANVINADVKIRYSKGVTFSNNHMERGVQIVIDQSEVTMSNNFIEKGLRPSVVIKSGFWRNQSVVNMNSNQYAYYSKQRELYGGDGNSLSRICDYDIMLTGSKKEQSNPANYSVPDCIVNISNELRYWLSPDSPGNNFTTGIALALSADAGATFYSADAYNNASEIYSRQSTLTVSNGEMKIAYPPVSIKGWSGSCVYLEDTVGLSQWFAEEGHYYYYYQIILNYSRLWVPKMPMQLMGEIDVKSECVYFILGGSTALGNSVMVRMIRCRGSEFGEAAYADVPLINTHTFYDNGYTVGGYKWHKVDNFSSAVFNGTQVPVSGFTLVGDSVIKE